MQPNTTMRPDTARRWMIWSIALLLPATTTAVSPQVGQVVGHLVTRDGKGVVGATCRLDSGEKARTGRNGRFAWPNVAAGKRTVRCSKRGFRPAIGKFVVTGSKTSNVRVVALVARPPADTNAQAAVRSPPRELRSPKTRKLRLKPIRTSSSAYGIDAKRGAGGLAATTRGRIRQRDRRPQRGTLLGAGTVVGYGGGGASGHRASPLHTVARPSRDAGADREGYDRIKDKPFTATKQRALSTVSIDVDTAAYSNVRRFANRGVLPPRDAVRIEELINYFDYPYTGPKKGQPFAIHTEVSTAPWNSRHRLVHIGLQGRRIETADLPPNNLVFLLDVSGSMASPNKLPLLKAAFSLLVAELRPIDRVSIVVYAGAAGVVLAPTPGSEKGRILAALENLRAGGSTAGGAGISLAYELAQRSFLHRGNNRVILATDGDFNVGQSSDGQLVRMIEDKRKLGVFLTVLGFGEGNYQDAKMQKLADHGNGHHAYIDSLFEAQKVLVRELGATLLTIAKDVKVQLEMNPTKIKAWRLIGYENRVLAARDFADDRKDAGELGAGHSVTFLYELIPADSPTNGGATAALKTAQKLRYQTTALAARANSDELLHVKLRYKKPRSSKSLLITSPLRDTHLALKQTSNTFRFAAAVAEFGLALRRDPHRGTSSLHDAIRRARHACGDDPHGDRKAFVELARKLAKLPSPDRQG